MKKLLATLSAAALCGAMLPLQALAAEPNSVPDWMPETFEEAAEFRNTYGAVHIEGDCIGVVLQTYPSTANSYRVEGYYSGTNKPADDPCLLSETLSETGSIYSYEVRLYKPQAGTDFDVRLIRTYNSNDYMDAHYCFQAAENAITQTDLYAWVPDSLTEYQAFIEEHGTVSVHDRYILYCGDVNYSTGATLQLTQKGNVHVEEVISSSIRKEDLWEGGTTHVVNVYQPDADGTVQLTWTVGREWEPEDPVSVIEKAFTVSDFGETIRETEGFVPAPVQGDVNGDGRLNVLDVVAVQKWLLALPDAHLTDAAAGDMDGDGVLDVFDLSLMKRALLTPLPPAPAAELSPLLLIEGEHLVEMTDDYRFDPYSRELTSDTLAESPEILALIDKITAKTDTLADTEMESMMFGVEDYGEDCLYLAQPRLLLAKFGEESVWLADEDVKELVLRLIAADEFGSAALARDIIMNEIFPAPADTGENRDHARALGAYALARLQDGSFTLDTRIDSDNAAQRLDEETAQHWNEAFLFLRFVDAHTVMIELNGGLLDVSGYLITDGTVRYETGSDVPVPGEGFDGGVVQIADAQGDLYKFNAGL